jgi:hypothetical protein
LISCPLARTDDHTKAVLMPGDTPSQDQQTAQHAARQVK